MADRELDDVREELEALQAACAAEREIFCSGGWNEDSTSRISFVLGWHKHIRERFGSSNVCYTCSSHQQVPRPAIEVTQMSMRMKVFSLLRPGPCTMCWLPKLGSATHGNATSWQKATANADWQWGYCQCHTLLNWCTQISNKGCITK